jgi:hypothetical protein
MAMRKVWCEINEGNLWILDIVTGAIALAWSWSCAIPVAKFLIIGWGWFYLSTILDDFLRYIIA